MTAPGALTVVAKDLAVLQQQSGTITIRQAK